MTRSFRENDGVDSMQPHEHYRYIWFCGDQLGLLTAIREYLVKQHGEQSVRGLEGFVWHAAEFAILYSHSLAIVITAPIEGVEDTTSWNSEIQDFYEQVVLPVSDTTGGVSVGLAEPGPRDWLKLGRIAT